MINKEKVIDGIEETISYLRCHVGTHIERLIQHQNDAISLLKEQEAVEPIPPTDELDLWKCGNCNHRLFRCTHQRYCEMCGKPVKWE